MPVTVRSVRLNFASCVVSGSEKDTLVILPTAFLAKFGRRTRTFWDILLEED